MTSKLLKILIIVILFVTAAGTSAYLTLSFIIKSEETVVVPALQGKDVVYALQILSDLDLNTRIKASAYSASIPSKHVIEQDPAPGSEIKKGRDVKLVISMGQLSATTPDLTGLSIRQALIIIEENGLCQGTRSRSKSFNIAEDALIAQSPQPGVAINRNTCINLLISSGRYPGAFAMTDLSTLPVDEAILKIETNRLKLGDITEASAQEVPLNTVASQTPPAGYRVVTGQAVHLGVNRTRSGTDTDGDAGNSKSWFFRYRTGDGFLNRHIKVRISSKLLSYDLFDDFISPTEDLVFLVPRFENIAVMLYEDGELIKTIFPGSRQTDSKEVWSLGPGFGLPLKRAWLPKPINAKK